MERARKNEEIAAIRDRFGRMAAAILTDFRGLDVESMNQLRSAFRQRRIEYKVVKNTLVSMALKERDYFEALKEHLNGPTAIAWSYEDPSAPAKIALDFAKDHEKFKIKCGVLDGRILDESGITTLSKMPGKKEIMASLLATFLAPAQGFVRLLAAAPTSFVHLLNARKRALGG